jgi:hypothetical protein
MTKAMKGISHSMTFLKESLKVKCSAWSKSKTLASL